MTKFNLEQSGVMDIICSELLKGHDGNRVIDAELYNLNVYRKHSFFKLHKDTPHSNRMFRSVVVVFPTCHKGGMLVLCHNGNEGTFDSAQAVLSQPVPLIAYITFYSDVEHEVTKVNSSHRVTLTYNLYFSAEKKTTVSTIPTVSPQEGIFEAVLVALLADPMFLPKGGYLGFGLVHWYPVNEKTCLQGLCKYLKGSNVIIQNVCVKSSLEVSLRVLYNDTDWEEKVMVDRVINLSKSGTVCESVLYLLQTLYDGQNIWFFGDPNDDGMEDNIGSDLDDDDKMDNIYNCCDHQGKEICWVTNLTEFTEVEKRYAAYRNEASIDTLYSKVFLIVSIGKVEKRATKV